MSPRLRLSVTKRRKELPKIWLEQDKGEAFEVYARRSIYHEIKKIDRIKLIVVFIICT